MLILFGWTNKKKPADQKATKRQERKQKSTAPIATTTKQVTYKKEERGANLWDRFGLLWTTDIGIDLGTANVLIYVRGKGIVLDEPAYVARDKETNEVIAIGSEARHILGRTPEGIEVIRPLQGGVIADYDATAYMLGYFIRTVLPASSFMKPRMIVCVPSGITPVEKRAVLEALLEAGARKTVLMEEPLAAAMGTGLDRAKSVGAMVVDIGGGTTDIAVLCDTGVVVSASLRLGSDDFDEALIEFMKRKRKLLIGKHTAEEMKIAVGTVDRQHEEKTTPVRGRDVSTGLPKEIQMTSSDIRKALDRPIRKITEGIKGILEKTPPELLGQIADHGIMLTGGGALIDGMDRLITRVTGIAAYLVDNPRYSVIMGTGRALGEMHQLRDTLEELR